MDGLRRFDAAPSMTDRVAASLREAITTLQLTPGSPIVEATVARQLGVSTTPVREALHRLAKDGLVVLNRHRGASVVTMSARDVAEIYQMREALEPLAVKLSAPHFTEAEIAAMDTLLREAGEAIVHHDWDALSRCNRQYHGMFIAHCGNDRLRSVLENLQDQNRIIALLAWHNRGYRTTEHEEHLAILEAVRRRDADAAAASALQHLTRFGQSIMDAWNGFSARPAAKEEVLR